MAEDVKIRITATDEATPVFTKVQQSVANMGKSVGNDLTKAGDAVKKFGQDNVKTFQNMSVYGGLATAGLFALGKTAVDKASQMQDLRIELNTLTGSLEKGGQLFKDIQKEAAKTPFESPDLVKATSTMLQFGIAQEDVMANMRMLGDISGGNANKLQSLSLVFGQISSAGKLTGQDLLQLVNLGFNPLKTMSDRTGESMSSLRDKMADGAISFEMVQEEMRLATSEGGLFFNMMDQKSQTFSGLMSTLSDNVGIALASLGGFSNGQVVEGGLLDMLSDAMKSLMPYLEQFTTWASENPTIARNIFLVVGGIAALVTGIGALGLILPVIGTGMAALGTAFTFLTGPIGLIILAVGALWLAWETNFLGIRDITANVMERVSTTITNALNWINETRNMVLGALGITNEQFWNTLQMVVQFGVDTISTIFNTWRGFVRGVFTTGREGIKTIFRVTWEALKTLVSGSLEGIRGVIVGGIQMVASFFNGGGREAFNKGRQTMMGGIVELTKTPINAALGVITNFVNGVINTINRLIRAADKIGFSFREIDTISLPKFATGGIVKGPSMSDYFGGLQHFATGGLIKGNKGVDKVPIMAGDGELVLNKAQQGNLASFIKGNNSGTTIEVVVSGNSFYGDDQSFAQKIGDTIIRQFQRDYAFESF